MRFGLPTVLSAMAFLLLVVLVSASAGCGLVGEESERLTLTGSSTVAPLMVEIGRRFEDLNPGVRIDVQTGGSSRGIVDVRSGVADIGMVSRALHPEESDLQAHLIARDGVTMIVHAENPVEALADREIASIYTGEITRWGEVGGGDAPITVVNKAEGRSTLAVFLAHFELENRQIEADVVIGDNEQAIKTVAGNPGSIGYVSVGAAEFSAENGVSIKLLPVGGVGATTPNVASGEFPLTRELNLVTRGTPAGLAEAFVHYARSQDVHDLIRDLYFVPVPESTAQTTG